MAAAPADDRPEGQHRMLELKGFSLEETIHQGRRTVVCRAVRQGDGLPVVLKFPRQERPNRERLRQLEYEFNLTRELDFPGVVRHLSLESAGHRKAIVMEDFGARSLRVHLGGQPLSIHRFLQYAAALAGTLEEIHRRNLVHKGIHPGNILVSPVTGAVKLADFSTASKVPRESVDPQDPANPLDALPYLSPEQTGRMNRSVDYRADFYSLGATFYEMITGAPPFGHTDMLELVHAHIALTPACPCDVRPGVPEVLGGIVMKLLAKTAEERYQSASVLRADLGTCLEQWEGAGAVKAFRIGAEDLPPDLRIPERLYGRRTETRMLSDAFEAVARGQSRVLFLGGPPGIGKTSLIREIHKSLAGRRGYFLWGKFDPDKQNVPYSAVLQAFQGLIGQLLTEPQESLDAWRPRLLRALGPNGRVVTDMLPDLKHIIGEPPPLPGSGPAEARNRFNLTFRNFVNAFCRPGSPLVVSIDDLQWADSAGLELLKTLVTDPASRSLLVVGTYRDNEVAEGHPLTGVWRDVEAAGAARMEIVTLPPLTRDDVIRLLSDSLRRPADAVEALGALVTERTGGNPFFVVQFLHAMSDEGILRLDPAARRWVWDVEQVRIMPASDSVAELMAKRLQSLPAETRQVVQHAACIGGTFDLQTLAALHGRGTRETLRQLLRAVQEGFVLPQDDRYRQALLPGEEEAPADVRFRFLHDRVRQAAYGMIPRDARGGLHARLGMQRLESASAAEQEARIFDIVDPLNLGVAHLTGREERERLAGLNLTAGRRARASAAYESAFGYLARGVELLEEDAWERAYELALALTTEAAEAATLIGAHEQTERFARQVERRARTLLHKVRVLEARIQVCIACARPFEGVRIGLQTLKMLGVHFPETPGKAHVAAAFLKTRVALAGKKPEDLLHLPRMTDPGKLAAVRILANLGTAAYFAFPRLFPLIVLKSVELSLRHGNAPQSAVAYCAYGIILCGVLGDMETGYRFGRLALGVLERLEAREFLARVSTMVNGFINHWKEPLARQLDSLMEAYRIGLETGDLEWAAYAAESYCLNSFFSGKDLRTLEQEYAAYGGVIAQLKQEIALYWVRVCHQFVQNLMGCTEHPTRLVGASFDEEAPPRSRGGQTDPNIFFIRHLPKLILCYLFHDIPRALESADIAERYIEGLTGQFVVPVFRFYDSLVRLAAAPRADRPTRQRLLRKVRANLKQLRTWARFAPENHLYKVRLVEAELARVAGRNEEASAAYERAVASAREQGYVHESALCMEVAVRFRISIGREEGVAARVREAIYLYGLWGAHGKVRDLETRYARWLQAAGPGAADDPAQGSRGAGETPAAAPESLSRTLDIETVIKASRAISGEIEMERLQEKLVQILMENAGADKVVLVRPHDGELRVEAQTRAGGEEGGPGPVFPAARLETGGSVPESVVRLAARKGEPVVLDDAWEDPLFREDPYWRRHRPRSVLCLPVIHQETLTALVYLENRLSEGVFTRERQEMLGVLAAQAAVSLRNSALYQDLRQEIRERRNAEEALRRSQGRIHHLTRQLIRAQETERQKIALDLHDNVAQHLSSARIFCETLFDPGAETDPQVRDRVRELSGRLQASITAVRELSYNLRPLSLDQLGLVRTAFHLCRDFSEKSGTEVDFFSAGLDGVRLDPDTEINLFRMLQEALHNVRKHAGPCRVTVRMAASYPKVILRVEDDGRGFDVQAAGAAEGTKTRMGLRSMEERAALLNGKLSVQSKPGRGTLLVAEVPWLERERGGGSGAVNPAGRNADG